MTAERWAQVRQIFDQALERPPRDRGAFLRVTCGQDSELQREVETLLASHAQSESFLEEPALNFSRTLLYDEEESGDYPEGYQVGSYQLQTCIGRGGMGSVWLAERVDSEFRRKVAVKLVKRGMDTHEILRRFRMERQMLASLDHPNIARLIDGGSTPDGLPYLVMEYVEGTPLDRYCEGRQSTISERLRLFRQVCAAVQYAHQNLIVHRDIKASNILVTSEGVPKLLDFGIAKLLRQDFNTMEFAAQTLPQMRPMTLEYASPEQVRGEAITTATDVYQLGVLLYRLLTAKFPYAADRRSIAAMHKAICEAEPRKPSSVIGVDDSSVIPQATQKLEAAVIETRGSARKRLKKKLAGDLDQIILKALRKEPQRRYASAEQFSEDVRHYLDGLPVSARGDHFGYRLSKFVSRHKAAVAAMLLVTVALVASTVAFAYYARAAGEERDRAQARFNRARDLARSVLFEFDDAIRSGGPSARKKTVDSALAYLDRLKPVAAGDLVLERELMEGYLRAGGMQGNLADLAGAAGSFEKALEIAGRLFRANPDSPEARRDVARVAARTGEVRLASGDPAKALERFKDAMAHYDALAAGPSGREYRKDVLSTLERLGDVQVRAGDLLGALASYTRFLHVAETISGEETSGGNPASREIRRSIAEGNRHLGEVLSENNAHEEGLVRLRKSLDLHAALSAEAPEDDAGVRALAATEFAMIRPLVRLERRQEARALTERALARLKPLADRPEPLPSDLRLYVGIMAVMPLPEARNAAVAVRYAARAVEITGGTDPDALSSLALAYEMAGDFARAVEQGEKAVALVAAGSSAFRSELESNLERFRRRK